LRHVDQPLVPALDSEVLEEDRSVVVRPMPIIVSKAGQSQLSSTRLAPASLTQTPARNSRSASFGAPAVGLPETREPRRATARTSASLRTWFIPIPPPGRRKPAKVENRENPARQAKPARARVATVVV
jgi:hypothetical protein